MTSATRFSAASAEPVSSQVESQVARTSKTNSRSRIPAPECKTSDYSQSGQMQFDVCDVNHVPCRRIIQVDRPHDDIMPLFCPTGQAEIR
jgi:hypothetical protein